MKAHTKESQAAMTPETSLQALKAGNERFITATLSCNLSHNLLGDSSPS